LENSGWKKVPEGTERFENYATTDTFSAVVVTTENGSYFAE